MPKPITLRSIRFQKYDRFNNPVFIANEEKELKLFKKLNKYYLRLTDVYPESFSPIYTSDEHKYSSIRFKKDYKHTDGLEMNNKYDVKFLVKKKVGEGAKIMINCHIMDIDLISKAPPIDHGDDLDFTDSETDTE